MGLDGARTASQVRKMLIFALEFIFAVFPLILVSRKGFGARSSVFRGIRNVLEGCRSMFGGYSQRVFKALIRVFPVALAVCFQGSKQRVFGLLQSSGADLQEEKHQTSSVAATGIRSSMRQSSEQ